MLDAFSPTPPPWTQQAAHALTFSCPSCQASPKTAHQVWLNRRSPVLGLNGKPKWQEFYHCECGQAWWGWSTDRPVPDADNPSTDET